MKLIIDGYEWSKVESDPSGPSEILSARDYRDYGVSRRNIALARESHGLIYWPQTDFTPEEIERGYKALPCSSIEDGKAKVLEHLRDAGVLIEGSDVNAKLLKALKCEITNNHNVIAWMLNVIERNHPNDWTDGDIREIEERLKVAIAKAEATQ